MSARDEQLRRRFLQLTKLREELHQGGYVPASLYARQATDDSGSSCDDDQHAERLLNELVEWNLIEEPRDPHHMAGAKREFQHRRFRLTKKGWALLWQDIPPMAGVADSRLEVD